MDDSHSSIPNELELKVFIRGFQISFVCFNCVESLVTSPKERNEPTQTDTIIIIGRCREENCDLF
jgi:uncharacterized CHY-type Zn-finger protein